MVDKLYDRQGNLDLDRSSVHSVPDSGLNEPSTIPQIGISLPSSSFVANH